MFVNLTYGDGGDSNYFTAGALMSAAPRHGTQGLDAFQLQAPDPYRGCTGITVHDTKGQQFFTEEEERFVHVHVSNIFVLFPQFATRKVWVFVSGRRGSALISEGEGLYRMPVKIKGRSPNWLLKSHVHNIRSFQVRGADAAGEGGGG